MVAPNERAEINPLADATTPNYGWTLPTFGMDRDTWGNLVNANFSALDSQLKTVDNNASGSNSRVTSLINTIIAYIEPIGSMKPWPNPVPPANWLACDGQAISRTAYAGLFAVIGGYWGAGDGATTFNVPNLLGRVPAHRDNGTIYFTGQYGEFTHTLSQAEMPVHAHGVSDPGHFHFFGQGFNVKYTPSAPVVGYNGDAGIGAQGGYNTNTVATGIAIQNAGSGGAHNNIQPTTGILWIIKAVNPAFP